MTSCNRTMTGGSDHPGHIDHGTLARHRSKSRSITGSPRCVQPPIRLNALIFDEEFVTRFLSSVAHAIVLERNTKVTWFEYRDSKVLNGIYAAMGVLLDVGSPGWAEVDSGDIDRINVQKAELEMHLYESFVNALTLGPSRVTHFLNSQDEARTRTLESVRGVYRDVNQINQGVADEARRGIARLA